MVNWVESPGRIFLLTTSAEIHVQYETTPDLVSGIELTANGQKIAWSISDYLASLEKGVAGLLIKHAEAVPADGTETAPKLLPKPDERRA